MRAWKALVEGVAVLALMAAPGVAVAGQAGPGGTPRVPATIARVDDGRTLWLTGGATPPTQVRLAWIAVPAAPAEASPGEPHGAEARQRLEVWRGQPVELLEVGRGPDGVPLVEVLWKPTGESVVTLNYEMVRSGFARADCSTAGAYALQCRVLRRAEDLARYEKRGMWAAHP